MKLITSLLLLSTFFLNSCIQESKTEALKSIEIINTKTTLLQTAEKDKLIIEAGKTIETRFAPPSNYIRPKLSPNSFASYLRQIPLKPHGSKVLYYDGNTKPYDYVYDAVIDLKIGSKNLHQCADAIMRLRAEYLWEQERYDEIHFNFTNGFRVDYTEWMKGRRMQIQGNKTQWIDKFEASNTYEDFWNYMELIFSYAGTLSLSKELKTVRIEDMQIGDVFIYGGSPGHAILVIDMVINPTNNEKLFLLAQSYMPAQETQILKNPNNENLSPWYALSEEEYQLTTPEWSFTIDQLTRFSP